ncbi:hypothetical protein [Luteolibacter sp. Populi]|uniref:hypothetical protein n=1 Tax=Luteolibacter sp. Populi TaxID=3230487 RepID=UPI003467D528
MMSYKPNVPNEICPGKEGYSWQTDRRVNSWLFLAVLISAASGFFFPGQVRELPVAWRTMIALSPFLILPLWAGSVVRWVRGMDELHRRITTAAVLFAVSACFFFVLLWHRLEVAGFFEALVPGRNGWDIGTIGHISLLFVLFYGLGYSIFNRRYQ